MLLAALVVSHAVLFLDYRDAGQTALRRGRSSRRSRGRCVVVVIIVVGSDGNRSDGRADRDHPRAPTPRCGDRIDGGFRHADALGVHAMRLEVVRAERHESAGTDVQGQARNRDAGAGQLTKAANQMVVGTTIAIVGEALVLAAKAGVDPAKVRQALLGGFAASRVLEVHGERILTSNYKPGFRASLYAKDLRIASSTLAEFATPAPVSSAVHQLVEAQVAAGEGEDDYSAVARVVFKLAGLN